MRPVYVFGGFQADGMPTLAYTLQEQVRDCVS